MMTAVADDATGVAEQGDHRFKAAAWQDILPYSLLKQGYLNSRLIANMVGAANLDEPTRQQLSFYTRQFIDSMSPNNFAATNPQVMQLAVETTGQSIRVGFENLLTDMGNGTLSIIDQTAFEVGKNVAVSERAVAIIATKPFDADLVVMGRDGAAGVDSCSAAMRSTFCSSRCARCCWCRCRPWRKKRRATRRPSAAWCVPDRATMSYGATCRSPAPSRVKASISPPTTSMARALAFNMQYPLSQGGETPTRSPTAPIPILRLTNPTWQYVAPQDLDLATFDVHASHVLRVGDLIPLLQTPCNRLSRC
ncbi:hypothetical protein LJR034_004129 [Caballeronia sp. LjRoot34]|uniref:hypothetical protein n=1 Tax=Caballeronia sp. LjRoot34 TaxID=3342325 RepID=UPI003ECF6E22